MKHRLLLFPVIALLASTLLACGGSETDRTADIIHRLLQAAGTEGSETLESFPGSLPPDLPAEPPLYPGAELVVSSRQPGPVASLDPDAGSGPIAQPLLYFIVLDTEDGRDAVYAYYEEALEREPWQVQSAFSTEELDTIQFFNVEDIDIGGAISIAQGGGDGRTSILISLQDAGAFRDEEPPFELQPSVPVPSQFPPDVPIYDGATVTGTAFFREPGSESFLVIFLTTANQDEVIGFYRETFQSRGWTVQDTAAFGLEGRIDFRDERGDIQGDVLADRFPRSRSYTEVSVQVQINPSRVPVEAGDDQPEEDEADPAEEPQE